VGEFVANAAILFGIKALNCDAVCFRRYHRRCYSTLLAIKIVKCDGLMSVPPLGNANCSEHFPLLENEQTCGGPASCFTTDSVIPDINSDRAAKWLGLIEHDVQY
jgi:hypothetical protein